MTGGLTLLAIPLILLIVAVLLVMFILLSLGKDGEKNVKGAGVFLIGPIPVIVSGGKAVAVALILMLVFTLVFILLTLSWGV